jgi:hypothetical protein
MAYLRRAAFFVLVLLVAADTPGLRADDVSPLLPAETDYFFSIDFHQIPRSQVFKKYLREPFLKEWNKQATFNQQAKEYLDKFKESTGIDLLTDVEKVAVGWTTEKNGEPPPFTVVVGKLDVKKLLKDVGNPHPVVVLTGKFDPEKLTAAAVAFAAVNKEPYRVEQDGIVVKYQLNAVRENDHTLLKFSLVASGTPQAEGKTGPNFQLDIDFYGAVVDRQRLIFGLKSDVLAALDRAKRKAGAVIRRKDVADTLERLDPATVCSVRIDNSILKQLPGVDDPNTAKTIEKVAAVWLDLQIDKDIRVGATLEMIDADAAKELKPELTRQAEAFKTLFGLLLSQEPKAAPLGDIGKNFTITSKGKKILMQTSLSEKAIDDLAKVATGK